MDIFRFQNYQLFSKYHARKVKFRRFTCIKIEKERFAAKNVDCSHLECFLKQKIYH